jgi:hypothetical protein
LLPVVLLLVLVLVLLVMMMLGRMAEAHLLPELFKGTHPALLGLVHRENDSQFECIRD